MKNHSILAVLDERFHRFIDTIGEVPYVALPPERPEIICFAGKVKALSGYDANDVLTDRQLWVDMIHPDDRERVFAAFAKCKNEGTQFEIEYRIIHKDGSLRYVIDKGEPVFGDSGEIIRIEGVITLIGERGESMNMQLSEISKVKKFSNVTESFLSGGVCLARVKNGGCRC